ncbi:MAG: hypothetical protein IPH80_41000 [Myxococcales bacterium]|nr:hypothetical protein [Myxococcales bacterium]
MYRYGDGTPFPFDDNVIDLLPAVIDACAAMFGAAAHLDGLRAKAKDARRDADAEGAELAGLAQALEAAVAPLRPALGKDASAVQEAAQRALDGARQALAGARAGLERKVAQAAAEPRLDRALAVSFTAAAALFAKRALPRTAWSWAWKASGGSDATATSARFGMAFDLTEPPWPGPVRLATLAPTAALRLPRRKLIGKPALARIALDRAALLEARKDGAQVTLVLREHAHKPSPGWRLISPRADAPEVTAVLLDERGGASRHEELLSGDDAAAVGALVAAVDAAMTVALAHRKTREVTLGGTELRALTDPAEPGRALLELLAPTIRGISERSRVPGELSLKRDLGQGRREELFVARAALIEKYAALPPPYRALFDAAGLGRDAAERPSLPVAVPIPAPDVELDRALDRALDHDDDDLTTDRRPAGRAQPPPPPPRAAPGARTLLAV